MNDEWKTVDDLAQALSDRLGPAPRVAAVLGSGLGGVADRLEDAAGVRSAELPGWPASTVEGHAGAVQAGTLSGVRTALLQGRAHLYEGYSPAEVVRPIRAAITWGASIVVLTNAAGAIAPDLDPGRLMLIEDHLNFTGRNPLTGAVGAERGPRFPDLCGLYDKELGQRAFQCAERLGVPLTGGVYAGMPGPSYETPAEIRFLKKAGASAVGMSTVLEAIAAGHLGARVIAISCLTNRAAGLPGAVLDHEHVQKAAAAAASDLARLVGELMATLGDDR